MVVTSVWESQRTTRARGLSHRQYSALCLLRTVYRQRDLPFRSRPAPTRDRHGKVRAVRAVVRRGRENRYFVNTHGLYTAPPAPPSRPVRR